MKVWAFDRNGRPSQSGTGLIVDAGAHRALILTATHVIDGAASIRIDVSRDVHDLRARIERTGPHDLTLLTVDRGGLQPAHFAPPSRQVIEGNLVAVAGYVKNDELIGIAGQAPRILFPGTVSSRPDAGRYFELENVHIEEGLSGGAVFDPQSGDVLGIVTSRTADRRGGFADSAAAVVQPFLAAYRIASARAAVAPPLVPSPVPAAPELAVIGRVRKASPRSLPAAVAPLPALELVQATIAPLRMPPAGVVAWQSAGGDPKRFVVMREGCRTALTIDVQTLQFVVAHQALVTPHHRDSLLGITLQQRAGNGLNCSDVADMEPTDGAYEPTAMSFNGHHVTMRFVYTGDRANQGLFPSDASIDADLDVPNVVATVQFFDRAWNGAMTLPLTPTALAAVSSTW